MVEVNNSDIWAQPAPMIDETEHSENDGDTSCDEIWALPVPEMDGSGESAYSKKGNMDDTDDEWTDSAQLSMNSEDTIEWSPISILGHHRKHISNDVIVKLKHTNPFTTNPITQLTPMKLDWETATGERISTSAIQIPNKCASTNNQRQPQHQIRQRQPQHQTRYHTRAHKHNNTDIICDDKENGVDVNAALTAAWRAIGFVMQH